MIFAIFNFLGYTPVAIDRFIICARILLKAFAEHLKILAGHEFRLNLQYSHNIEARNFSVILTNIPFAKYEKISFTE